MAAPARVVADVGNSRIKCALLGPDGRPRPDATVALPADAVVAWPGLLDALGDAASGRWAVASVNPAAEAALLARLAERGGRVDLRVGSAADVPQPSLLECRESTGADRALAVLAALDLRGKRGPGLVVQCGTALTVERIDAAGNWHGGAIAPGAAPALAALHGLTARLPALDLARELAGEATPPAWGRSTVPAMTAGVYWGLVGAARELIARQSADLAPGSWVVWTGGDAAGLAREVGGPGAVVVPDLVLRGLALLARRAWSAS